MSGHVRIGARVQWLGAPGFAAYDHIPVNSIGRIVWINKRGFVTARFPQGKAQAASAHRFGIIAETKR
jgi:hypothetical protein